MSRYLNHWVGLAAALALAALPCVAVHAADVKSARVWAGPDYTRVVLDADGPLSYKISEAAGQVQVNLDDSRALSTFVAPAAQGLYRGMTHARVGHDLQLTAKIAPNSRVNTFLLKPTTGKAYRLVLDFYPSTATATASALGSVQAVAAPAQVADAPSKVTLPSSRTAPHSSRVATREAASLLDGQRAVVVAIDAGHGGKDSGAIGPGGTQEKNVTLAVARDLAALINRQPGMKAILTRNGDYFIPLKERYRIARQNDADLFVSVHADSFTSGDAKGSSVWVLSPRGKTSEAARWLADRENRADLIGGTTLDDRDDDLAKVLLDMQQGWAMQASDVVAGNVLKALAQLGPTHRGYVERANFVVLRSPDVPSILVETAFISNPAEEKKLRDAAHQKQLAEAVMDGVKSYFEAAPPLGTYFAAQAARKNGVELASNRASSASRNASKSTSSASKTPVNATIVAMNKSASADDNVRDRHRVSRGESLRSIAQHYGVSVGALKTANRINVDTVRAGAVLTIPAS
ncbi:MAG: N-acetylmuramoyl-L-alanine amidase [Rhodanobacter sp.]